METNNQDFMMKRISELEKIVAETGRQARKYRLARRKVEDDLTAEREARQKLAEELEGLKAAPPDEWKVRFDAAQKEIWKRDQKDTWKSYVGEKLVEGVPIEEIWSKIGYEPGSEQPTPEFITARLEQAKQVAPYLFRADGTAKGTPPTPAPQNGAAPESQSARRLTLPPDLSRGSRAGVPGELVVTRDQLRDPAFMMNPGNKKAMAEARKAGVLVIAQQ